MPLVNRAPIDPATGKLMVTTTTPTAAWPSIGAMTYKPDTGELAVIDAVPAAGDPWNGGIRFTNLGAMYVTTVLPAPIFYIGGIVVSADGRVFMSSGAPLYGVGGWPIAADGGVAGSGLSPQPMFFAPLMTTLVPTTAGNPTFTFTRNILAYVADNEGILRQAMMGEARFQGARRVANAVYPGSKSEGNVYIATGTTPPTTGVVAFDGKTNASFITFPAGAASSANSQANSYSATPAWGSGPATVIPNGAYLRFSGYFALSRPLVGAEAILVNTNGAATFGPLVTFTAALQPGTTFQRFSTNAAAGPQTVPGAGYYINPTAALTAPITVYVWGHQVEVVGGQSNQAPSEYVSVGMLAAPWHGNGVDGVKYFNTTNGNSVTGNVVTEAPGVPIPLATTLGYVAENTATNLNPQSQTFNSWNNSNAPVTADTQIAPDGTLTADTIADDATNAAHWRSSNPAPSVTAGNVYTVSCYLKAGTASWIQLAMYDGAGRWANFNLANGTVGFKQASVTTTSIVPLPNGWYRCSFTYTGTGTGPSPFYVGGLNNADTNANLPAYVGTGLTVYAWGYQVEQASDPSSYIPTTTAAVVRNLDQLSYLAVVGNADGAVGTAYAECTLQAGLNTGLIRGIVDWAGYYPLNYPNSNNFLLGRSSGGIVTTVNSKLTAVVNKNAAAWSGATMSVCLNGGAVATGTFAAYANSGNLAFGWNLLGSLRNVKFYATRLTDVELQAMTT
jgi:hypothetical protein